MDDVQELPVKVRLARTERKFDALLLASASIVWWTNAAGEFIEEQPYWQEYTGQIWEEYQGSRWTSCLHPDDRDAIKADWTAALTSGSPYFTQGHIWSAKHKAFRAFQTRAIAIRDEHGQILEWLGALTDIQDSIDTKALLERTQVELANSLKGLRLSEATSRAQAAELQAVYDAAPAGLCVIGEDGRFVRINRALASTNDMPAEAHIGRNLWDIVPQFRTVGEPALFRALNGEVLQVEVSGKTAGTKGETGYWQSTLFPLTLAAGAKAVGVIVEDITGWRDAEQRLRESEARLTSEAAGLKRLNEASSRLWRIRDLGEGLNEMLRAAISLVGADKGNIQLVDTARGVLTIAAQHGFHAEFLDFFAVVSAGDALACGRAFGSTDRIIIEDVEEDEDFAPFRAVAAAAGFRAVQSTPLIGRDGTLLGILSTHFLRPHRPAEQELQLLDLYTRQATEFIERHRREELLGDSEERYRGLYRNAAMGISITDLSGRFQSCNPAYATMHGYTEEELRSKCFDDVVHPAYRDRHAGLVRQLVGGEIPSFEIVNMCLGKDGKQLWVQKHVSLLKKANGEPTHVVALVTDITERKQAEEALKESENRLRLVAEHAEAGYWYRDIERGFSDWTPLCKKLFGLPIEEKMTYARFIDPDDRERVDRAVRDCLESGGKTDLDIEYRTQWPDGTVRWIHSKGSATFVEGRPLRIAGIALDVTERKRQDERIDLLVREVNHRSKNLLTLVQAIARQTAATKPDDFLDRFGIRIQALAASHDLLVDNDWRGVDLNALVRAQLAHFLDLIDERIELRGPPLFVSASAAQALGMAFHELATNAGKYGALSDQTGRVSIAWEIQRQEGGEDTFAIEWREGGGPAVTAPSSLGFGSTLISAVAEITLSAKVELCHPAEGLIWRLRCPLGVVSQQRTQTLHRSEKRVSVDGGRSERLRILVVEDEALIALEIEQILKAAGFEVLGPATKVGEALELLEMSGCDAAVLDINLGNETSEPVARVLSQRGTPFVTVSGYSRDQRPSVFNDAPFLVKPVRSDLLVAQLRRSIERNGADVRLWDRAAQ